MGGMKHYNSEGGFSQWLYTKVGESITINGMTGKIIKKIDDESPNHSGLPLYSNTSDFYVKISEDDSKPEQIRIFKNRKVAIDIDWNHPHKPFKIGDLHVHEYVFDKSGKPRRLPPREATDDEIKKYGALIKKFKPES